MTSPSVAGLIYSAVPVAVAMAILAVRRLGQVRPLLVAIVRLVVQLTLLGFVLEWLFTTRSPWSVGAIALVMLLASAHTVGSRLKGGGWTLRLEAFATMGVGMVLVMAVSLRLGLRVAPWYEPKVVIPLLGMILGNSVTGVALAAERLESDLRAERDRVELRLALGASSRQAALPALRSAVRAALTPPINNMMIAGIVAIPGMTTGQLLAGARVQEAIRYQILIYLGITGTVAISTLALLAVRLRTYFTPAMQLRVERLGLNNADSSVGWPARRAAQRAHAGRTIARGRRCPAGGSRDHPRVRGRRTTALRSLPVPLHSSRAIPPHDPPPGVSPSCASPASPRSLSP